MILRQRPARRRSASAAVELAFMLPFLLIVLLGVWEIGRLIQVQQILNNAAREGARLASLGRIINQYSSATDIRVATGTPNVTSAIQNYLTQAGIPTSGLTVNFVYTSGTTSLTEPYQAIKGQRFKVSLTIPFNNVKWTLLGLSNITTLGASAEWSSMIDDPFTINTTLPTW